jgi:uncharacterized membrane protein YqjE
MADEVSSAGGGGGVLGALSRLLHALLQVAETRLDLLSNEVQLEALRLGRVAVYGAAALVLLAFAVLFGTLFVIVALWNVGGVAAGVASIAVFTLLYAVVGVVLLRRTLRLAAARSFMFEASVAELAKDRRKIVQAAVGEGVVEREHQPLS